ncbi:DNA mismatch repair endonuclease MutL [Dendrosporobacter sp. 1207_IL3150]|uniref:DNA mismatch repair endonuclease MutL n=1 Tax=Dendrosporobacter sp. 1207_IL3150 TaxID=3084054 RepID=UPI002FDB3A3D
MSIIKILDENTANKIAAGEVVERPASVVKELIENSIDAHSDKIEIEIADGGISYIRVTDNGIGMSREDASRSILRHATSKIHNIDDLSRIHTLGFRGEALPTIASVSHFSLTTRSHNENLAAYVEVEGGVITDEREAGGNIGTTIIIQNLFFNTPARKKFLKKPASESSHIHDIIVKLALSHPNIAFKLINNSRIVLSTPGNNQLFDTITSLYGSKVSSELLPIYFSEDDIEISGFLSKPTILKSSRQWQTYIINSRVVNSRSIAKALDNAYHSLLPKSGYPLAVLNIRVPANTVDVNVHPQKAEIKFADESSVFKAVYRSVKDSLTLTQTPSQIAATVSSNIIARPIQQPAPKPPQVTPSIYSSTPMQQPLTSFLETPISFTSAQTLISTDSFADAFNSQQNSECNNDIDIDDSNFELYPLGQINNCYIIAFNNDGLYIIDQHAAHERILYDRLCKTSERIPAQQLLVPLFLDFDEAECNTITDNNELFYGLGFSIELIGPNTMRLNEVPADTPLSEAESIVRQILKAVNELHTPSAQELRHSCLQIASCRAAIKAGDSLNMRQIQALISELCSTSLPYTCPHGRPSIVKFSPRDLEKMFKRT